MKAMVLQRPGGLLVPTDRPDPVPGPGRILIRVHACAVCRTDLHVIDGELPDPVLPLVPESRINFQLLLVLFPVGIVFGAAGSLLSLKRFLHE